VRSQNAACNVNVLYLHTYFIEHKIHK